PVAGHERIADRHRHRPPAHAGGETAAEGPHRALGRGAGVAPRGPRADRSRHAREDVRSGTMADDLILIVEDNPRNAKLIRELLRLKGYATVEADSGEAGIEVARERRPALILMDVQLGGMDGVQALRMLRADDRTRNIPVVALTAFAMKGDRERLLAEGFDGYMQKPIEIKDLPRLVQSYLGRPG